MITPFYRDKLLVPQVCAQKNPQMSGFLQRELGGTRTPNLLGRNQGLYPIKLPVR